MTHLKLIFLVIFMFAKEIFAQPTVVSISRLKPSTTLAIATSVIYRVTFSEPVTGVDTSDFTIMKGGAVTGNISLVALHGAGNTGAVYDVTVSSVSGSGTLRLNINSPGTAIMNASGIALSGGYTAGETYCVLQNKTQRIFSFVLPLEPVDLTQSTKDKPQAKVWKYANQWWCVLSATGGTQIYRLDGAKWTSILRLATRTSKPDCLVNGKFVHILAYSSAGTNSLIYTIEYDQVANTYHLWSGRPASSTFVFPPGSETATLMVDGTGRMWTASAGQTDLMVWWSDAPYVTWSNPITLATGLKADDICAIADISSQGKIGVFWSNQNTRHFGFRTHLDGTDPATWTPDESPASKFALDSIGYGMADDHMNIQVAKDGTLYCAAKTGYNTKDYPKVILLVRRPSGVWDQPYTVTSNPEGTQPLLLFNEVAGKLKVVYASKENGGDIICRESGISTISFGPPVKLINGSGKLYDYATSTHQNYNSDIVILATDLSSPNQKAVGVLAFDNPSLYGDNPVIEPASNQVLIDKNAAINVKAYPNPFTTTTNVNFKLEQPGMYTVSLYDNTGRLVLKADEGWADGGVEYVIKFNGAFLPPGFYSISVRTKNNIKTTRLFLNKQ